MNKHKILLFIFATISFSANANQTTIVYNLLSRALSAAIKGKSTVEIVASRHKIDTKLAAALHRSDARLSPSEKANCTFVLSRLHCAIVRGDLPKTRAAITEL